MITTNGIVSTTGVLPPGYLPNLSKGNVWIGDNNNRPKMVDVSNSYVW